MASIFGHSAVSYTLARIIDNKKLKYLLIAAIFSSILPDFDVLAFKLGVAYEHPLGHRGFTHSILFAVVWAYILMKLFGNEAKKIWFLVIFLSTISHGVLDAMTDGGKGVGFFIPFINDRFFLPLRVIKISPVGYKQFFSDWGIQVISSEIKYVLLPCTLILLILYTFKKVR
jgi:inner membrane protein